VATRSILATYYDNVGRSREFEDIDIGGFEPTKMPDSEIAHAHIFIENVRDLDCVKNRIGDNFHFR
jgi:hypothetical protein